MPEHPPRPAPLMSALTAPDALVVAGPTAPTARTLYCCTGATTDHAGDVRRTVRAWTTALGLAHDLTDDLVLAVYEALTNVVDHAYRGRPAGPMTLISEYAGAAVITTVSDRGRWRSEGSAPEEHRGRGLPLIRALAATVDIDAGSSGTTVHLHHTVSPLPGPFP